MSQTIPALPEPEHSAPLPCFVRVSGGLSVPGYLPRLRQPAVMVEFQLLTAAPAPVLQTFMSVIEAAFGAPPELEDFPEFKRWPVLACVARATLGVLQHADWALLSKLLVFKHKTLNDDRALLAFPSVQFSEQGVQVALQGVLRLLYLLGAAVPPGNDPAADLRERVKLIKTLAPRGMNTLHFLEAAHAQDIPWKRLADNVYQFGWGARARWLDSSFTDLTPSISARLSRDKRAAASILRQAGVPVPPHSTANSAAQALSIAEHLGYPVVVKPADLDGGRGVFAFLNSPAEVTKAFAAASALSRQVIVEKHFEGKDYRLQVFQGDVYWATLRTPAGVTGDGTYSVSELVKLTNAAPYRGGPGTKQLKWITLDDETDTWLARQALTLDAVPASGRFVRLRGAANVASGGTIEPVLKIAHPDNLALAARAANILRLDLAGIDLLIPDIRRSWLETGAAICEVNAQPQMSPHLPAELLPRLVTKRGRIPVLVVLGGERDAPDCKALFEGLRALRPGFGFACRHGAWVSGHQVAAGPLNCFQAGQCLLDDPAVTMLALHVEDTDLLQSGSPVDSIDHLLVAGLLKKNGAVDRNDSFKLAGWLASMSKKVWLTDAVPHWQHSQLQQAGVPTGCTEARVVLDHIIRTLDD